MVAQRDRAARVVVAGSEALAGLLALLGAVGLAVLLDWDSTGVWSGERAEVGVSALRLGVLAALLAPLMVRLCTRAQDVHRDTSRGGWVRMLLASVLSVPVLGCLALLWGLDSPGLMVGGSYAALQTLFLPISRSGARWALRRWWNRGRTLRVIIIGTGSEAQRVSREIAAERMWGATTVGFLGNAPDRHDLSLLGDRYLGRVKDLSGLLRDRVIDEVLVAIPLFAGGDESTAEVSAVCIAAGIPVTITSIIPGEALQSQRLAVRSHVLGEIPIATLLSAPESAIRTLSAKRALDIVGALCGLLITAPLWVIAAIAIKLDSPGPIFFVQRRLSLRGRRFPFVKFRTMFEGSEDQIDALVEENEVDGPVFKIWNDPRITRVGRYLRRYSIDELPQFLNVLAGHMSLVGPRPPLPHEVDQYELRQVRRLSVRPGMTCLWQISGRSELPFEEWIRLDLEYIDSWSLWRDLKILARTLPAVLRAKGAA